MKLSRKLTVIMDKVEKLVRDEIGEDMGIGLVVFPFSRPGEPSRKAEYQYVSNCERSHMHGAFKKLVEKWDANSPDIPPHRKQ